MANSAGQQTISISQLAKICAAGTAAAVGIAIVYKRTQQRTIGCNQDAKLTKEDAKEEVQRRKRKWLIAFDFDCTLTVRHFYKVFAWGYVSGHPQHNHFSDFALWCRSKGIPSKMDHGPRDRQIDITIALDFFVKSAGADNFAALFRELFLGGEDRISVLTAWFRKMSDEGVEFAIITAGTSAAVVRALATVPEWQQFFPSSHIWDTQQTRHHVHSVMQHKVLMMRDLSKNHILLVDDSAAQDPVPAWVLNGAQVKLFDGKLPYEGPGIGKETLTELEANIEDGHDADSVAIFRDAK